jgi:hypothetical protein
MKRLNLKCVLPWWVQPYIYALCIAAWIMGTQPDPEKLKRKLLKAIRFKVTTID